MKRIALALASTFAFASFAAHGAEYNKVQAENSRVKGTSNNPRFSVNPAAQ